MLRLGLLSVGLAALLPVVAPADTFNIPDGDVAGLIAAINAANGSTSWFGGSIATGVATTINLAPGGIYTLTQYPLLDTWNGPSGLPIITSTSPITINGNGAVIQRSSAAGTPDFRIIFCLSCDLTLDGVTIKGGKGGDGAGLLMKDFSNDLMSKVLIRNSTITENDTQYSQPVSYGGYTGGGGGINNTLGTLTVLNSTISRNRSFSGYGGGGIMNFVGGRTTIVNSTIFENREDSSGRGDAIASVFSPPGSVIVKNSVLASPTQGAGDDCYSGAPASLGHNIASDASCGLTGNGDLNSTNPLLGPLANNGGRTPTHAPLLGSPAIDAVPIAACTDSTGQFVATDQRGVPRPQGAACDVGSVELNPPFNIANGDVAGLIAAINAANTNPGADTINLAPGGTYTLTQVGGPDSWNGPSGLPVINSPIIINGNGAIIQRSSAAGTPDFRIIFWTSGDLTLDGVTIKGGKGGDGAGLLIKGSTNPYVGKVSIRNSTITENDTQYSGAVSYGGYLGGAGGGIQNMGSLTLTNSTISRNRSFSGYGGGGISNFVGGRTTIANSTLFENRNDSWGRGDAIADGFSPPGSIILKNSVLASPTQGAGDDCYVYPGYPGVVVSLGHNITSDASCGLTGSGDMNSTNPLLGPLANNGGRTPTHAPLLGSPAIDAVPTADCTDAFGAPIVSDQRGVARPQGAACDIGAVELTPGTTPTGTNVGSLPVDTVTGSSPVTLTFDNVTQPGTTSLTTAGTGAPPADGFKLGQPPVYYNLSTTAVFSGPVTVCVSYSGVSFGSVSNIRLFHYVSGAWVDVTTSVNISTRVVCGSVTSFSPFAIFESVYGAAVQSPISANGSSVFKANRGAVPVKFSLNRNGAPACALPPATIGVTRIAGTAAGVVNVDTFSTSSDNGTSFRIDTAACQYVYNLDPSSLGPGSYLVQITIARVVVGSATFGLQ